MAAFVAYEHRATDSPFDAYLSGRKHALTPPQKRGLALFYGKAQCSVCHSGPFQTDHGFHAIGMPQIGPGKGHGAPYADHGRAAVTGDSADLYKFRTPSLRNVALTAPYGHAGAYPTLEEVIRHHLSPMSSLMAYHPDTFALPALDGQSAPDITQPDKDERARIAAAIELQPQTLTVREIADLVAFLHALTDANAAIGRLRAPATVPSGLPVDKPRLN